MVKSRSEKLVQNMKMMGETSLPMVDVSNGAVKDKIKSLLNYIDTLNKIKRDSWFIKSKQLPVNGDILNDLYWKKKLVSPVSGEVFNYYYQ